MDTLQSIEALETTSEIQRSHTQIRSRHQFQIQVSFAILLAILIGGYELHMMKGTTFYSDEWPGLFTYSWSPHTLLRSQAGHNFYFSSILWNATMALFGTRSYLPFRVLGLLCNLFTAAAVFTYGWRRLSYGAGLLLGLVALTMGSSFQTVLWPPAALGILSIGVLAFSLLILEHPSTWGPAVVVVMLIAMIGSGAYGLLALVGVFVEILLRRRWGLLWVPIVPTILYLAWHVAFHAGLTTAGAAGVGPIPLENLTGAPSYVTQQLTATVAGLTGQVATMGAALTVGLVALLAWLSRRGDVDKVRVVALAAVPVFFWFLLAIARGQDAEFGAPRYVAFGALPIALLLVEAVRSRPRPRRFKYVAIALTCFCILANWNQLLVAGRDFRYLGSEDLAAQTALQMSAGYVPTTLVPSPSLATSLVAGPYLNVVRSFGSNAPSPGQLVSYPDGGRLLADSVLVAAGAIHFAAGSTATGCTAASTGDVVPVTAGRSLTVRVLSGPTVVTARRFADENPSQPLDTLSTPGIVVVTTEPDAQHFSSPVPWKFSLSGGQFEICR